MGAAHGDDEIVADAGIGAACCCQTTAAESDGFRVGLSRPLVGSAVEICIAAESQFIGGKIRSRAEESTGEDRLGVDVGDADTPRTGLRHVEESAYCGAGGQGSTLRSCGRARIGGGLRLTEAGKCQRKRQEDGF